MKTDLTIAFSSHAYCFVWTSESIERELSDEFSFKVPGAEHMQLVKDHRWDGIIRVYNRTTKQIYVGLVPRVIAWARGRGYTVENQLPSITTPWTAQQTQSLIAQHPVPFEVRDYQAAAITHGMQQQRCVLLSPTASGKSLILYYLIRARMAYGPILLIVPTISLVSQMFTDFESYGWKNAKDSIHQITGGKSKDTHKPIVVTTWQSVYKQPETWFSRYTSIFGDECHLYKANSLRGIMEKLSDCAFRIGVTGTLDDAKANILMVEGVFGPSRRVASTADLQAKGQLTPAIVQAHFLKYGPGDRAFIDEHKRSYADEIDYLVQHPGRMQWTVNFVKQLPGNVLVLFNYIEKHGIPLYHAMKAALGNTRPVYYISGDVSGESRERVRGLLEQPEHVVLTFGPHEVRCVRDEVVPMTGGGSKLAQDVTVADDVAEGWILNMKQGIPITDSTTATHD